MTIDIVGDNDDADAAGKVVVTVADVEHAIDAVVTSRSQQNRDRVHYYGTSHTVRVGSQRYAMLYGTDHSHAPRTAANGEPPKLNRYGGAACDGDTVTERYVTSGFLLYLFLLITIFFLIGLAWTWIFRASGFDDSDYINSDATPALQTLVSLFIGLSFYILVQFSFTGYTVPAEQFTRLCERLKCAAGTLFAAVDDDDAAAAAPILDQAASILSAHCYYAFRLFDPRGLEQPATVLGVSLADELTRSRVGVYAAETLSALTFMLRRRARVLERASLISGNNYSAFASNLRDMVASVEDARAARIAATPKLFRDYIFTTIFLFMLIVAPISIRTATQDDYVMWIGYPFISFIVLGFVFYKSWVGNPFDGSGRVCTVDYGALANECADAVYRRRACVNARDPK